MPGMSSHMACTAPCVDAVLSREATAWSCRHCCQAAPPPPALAALHRIMGAIPVGAVQLQPARSNPLDAASARPMPLHTNGAGAYVLQAVNPGWSRQRVANTAPASHSCEATPAVLLPHSRHRLHAGADAPLDPLAQAAVSWLYTAGEASGLQSADACPAHSRTASRHTATPLRCATIIEQVCTQATLMS